ncbi:MAG: hypothetical protein ACXADH_12570 [Candidatus Kariarchaeaceae archaeon]|jgi:hypothetical protein
MSKVINTLWKYKNAIAVTEALIAISVVALVVSTSISPYWLAVTAVLGADVILAKCRGLI